jgi:hypothetical protein
VHQRQGAERGATAERGEHLVVVDHQRALIGHEMLERVDAAPDHGGHIVENLLRPAGHRDMEGIVGGSLARGALLPGVERLEHAVLAGNDEIDHHGGAARQRGEGAAFPGLGGGGAHEGHFQMGMGIDAARHDVGALGVDDLVTGEIVPDRGDGLALDQYIGLVAAVGSHHGSQSVKPARRPRRCLPRHIGGGTAPLRSTISR